MLGLFGKAFKVVKEAVGIFGGTKELLRGKGGKFDVSRLLVIMVFGLIAQEYEYFGLNDKVLLLIGGLFTFIAIYKLIEAWGNKEKKDIDNE